MSAAPTAAEVVAMSVAASGAALLTRTLDRRSPVRTVDGLALGMIVCAGVYPAARRPSPNGRAATRRREWAGLTGWGVGALGLFAVPRGARRAGVALGWALHAVFDVVHNPGPGSVLPRCYPGLCAGADLGVAAALAWSLPRAGAPHFTAPVVTA